MVAYSKRLEHKQVQIEKSLSRVYKRIPKLVDPNKLKHRKSRKIVQEVPVQEMPVQEIVQVTVVQLKNGHVSLLQKVDAIQETVEYEIA